MQEVFERMLQELNVFCSCLYVSETVIRLHPTTLNTHVMTCVHHNTTLPGFPMWRNHNTHCPMKVIRRNSSPDQVCPHLPTVARFVVGLNCA